MEQIAAQWPLLAGFLILAAALLRVVQSLYEARLRDWQDFAGKAQERADRAEKGLAEQTDVLEEQARAMAELGRRLEQALQALRELRERDHRPRPG